MKDIIISLFRLPSLLLFLHITNILKELSIPISSYLSSANTWNLATVCTPYQKPLGLQVHRVPRSLYCLIMLSPCISAKCSKRVCLSAHGSHDCPWTPHVDLFLPSPWVQACIFPPSTITLDLGNMIMLSMWAMPFERNFQSLFILSQLQTHISTCLLDICSRCSSNTNSHNSNPTPDLLLSPPTTFPLSDSVLLVMECLQGSSSESPLSGHLGGSVG